jgi:long-chain acyl-CoA synthetase
VTETVAAVGVAAAAAATPDKAAVIEAAGAVVTFAELDRQADQLARALSSLGVGAEGFVGIALRNRIDYFLALQATWRLGAVVVPIPYRATVDELAYFVADAHLSALLVEPGSAAVAAYDVACDISELRRSAGDGSGDRVWTAGAMPELNFPYTSGTTGRPKGLRFTGGEHGFIDTRDVQRLLDFFGVRDTGNVHLCVAPLAHSQPRSFAQAALDAGQTVVLLAGFDAERTLRLVAEHGVTWMSAAPIHLARIAALPEETTRSYDLSSLRFVLHSAAPMPPEVKLRAMQLLPADVVWEIYGGTEGSMAVISPEEYARKPGSVGRAFPGRRLAVLGDDGRPLPSGQVGIVYAGSATDVPLPTFEYVGAEASTASAWRGDMFTLGDVGYVDDDGYLFLTDRAKDMIVSGGVNIYCAEVEHVLAAHPRVVDVAVFGVPDDEFGERVRAVVELDEASAMDPDAVVAELMTWSRSRLTDYKCPAVIDVVDALPRDATGKLRKRDLRAPFWENRPRGI